MEVEENKLIFFITDGDREGLVELFEFDTVELLKIEIHNRFDIPPHKQTISGWTVSPECENTVLNVCAKLNTINCLEVKDESGYQDNLDISPVKDLEIEAANSFVRKISNNYNVNSSIKFNTCRLMSAIADACLVPLEERKILLLYLHKCNDKFSYKFMENLKKPEVIEMLQRNFFILGWDVEEPRYQRALLKALKECSDLSNIADVIRCDVSTALCIVPIKDSVTVFSCLTANISDKDLLSTLSNAEKFLIIENQKEKDLEELEREKGNENDMNSVNYQQLMVDMLGDRDYDGFEYDQHDLLKKKIAFALYGQPKTEKGDGYDKKEMEQVGGLFDTILKNSNLIAQDRDRVEISFIYNCTEPLPSEKMERAKKYEDYNPNTDLMPVPIFVLRKCHRSSNPCRLFIDHMGRIYETWEEYKNRNKLHECEMVLPLNGRYEYDNNGNVLLERHLSPACGIDVKVLQGADYASMAGGLISGGIFVAAAIPGIAVTPALLIGGVVTGVSVGIYSIARSAYTLYDRNRHKQTLSFANSEARGAYINILAGALGFVGAGANMAVTQFAARGVNIGTGARAAVDAIAFVNIGASGVAVVNSGYEVIDKWVNENQSPSLLTMVQLTSSILFFGNAVYNFRTCSTIIEETQMRTLQSYQESLRSNRHRKTFTKLVKETIRQNNLNEAQGRAEVISAIRNIQNKDEVFAVLTRSNKDMNKKGIRISASGGEIVLNGVSIDFNEFAAMNKKEASSFLSNLPQSERVPVDTASTRSMVSNILTDFSIRDIESITNITLRLLSFCDGDIQSKIINALHMLLANLPDPIRLLLDQIFPNQSKYIYVMEVVINFFAKAAGHLEELYKNWIETGDDSYYNPLFRHIDVKQTKRAVKFFTDAVNMYYTGTHLTELALRELLTFFRCWLTKKIYEYQQDAERADKRRIHSASSPSRKMSCSVCGGYYYQPRN
ncbi:uncharacterized protein LOC108909309 isoform X1 [Anoplophora glabripennis]|uniref:uncharacterized protein LOC108909309 isoform X1 n=1 Tax=Anoplophora glabripennis TaxID=217634 RepID=UPI000874EBAA|nr:uncharacterized protein LOC108909309 isoform X1 [Anoplophora glabripennis]